MKMSRIWIVPFLAAYAGALGGIGCSDKTVDPVNHTPRIIDLIARPTTVVPGGISRISALVSDSDGDPLTYLWAATGGSFSDSSGSVTNWIAPDSAGTFTVFMRATDGADTVSRSVDVGVGSASLTVESDPSGAFITLDGSPTGRRTPATFAPLPPGLHTAAVSNPYFEYAFPSLNQTLEHADAETLLFEIRAPQTTTLDLGRGDLVEIGGLAFLPDGSGIVYAGRTAAGSGLFSASTFKVPAGGVLLQASVRMEEPLTISPDGDFVIYVSGGDSLFALPIQDIEGDGIVDTTGTALFVRKNAFGPALSRQDELAFSLTVSDAPASTQLLYGVFEGGLLGTPEFATTAAGRLPAWAPGEPYIAFMRSGLILYGYLGLGGPSSPDTLVADGYNTAPAWGKWGSKHVAYLHGDGAQSLTGVRLSAMGTPYAATISTSLEDPRFVAWDPAHARFAVSQHPGGEPEIRVFSRLPIP